MGFLDSFESGLERLVNGAFAKTFKSSVQPIELAQAIRSELDDKARILTRDRTVVPGTLTISLSADDYEHLASMGSALPNELAQVARDHAASQNYQFVGPVVVVVQPDDSLAVGQIEIASSNTPDNIVFVPTLTLNGRDHHLAHGRTVIGRSSQSTITVDDPGVSKQHLAIDWDGHRATATDLGSTNGTTLDGHRLQAPTELTDGAVLVLGKLQAHFRLVPQPAGAGHRSEAS